MGLFGQYSLRVIATLPGMLLISCDANTELNGRSENSKFEHKILDAQTSANLAAYQAAGATNIHQTTEEPNRDYYAPSNYVKYPKEVRTLIRRADLENGQCRGNSGDDPETLRACNRRQIVLIQLERKGWCWGGSSTGADQYWLKCADDPDYTPGQYGPVPYFTEAEINERANFRKKQ